ncbi:hypothetical protein V8C34DRAFT_191257 [Trichoderma compactum]
MIDGVGFIATMLGEAQLVREKRWSKERRKDGGLRNWCNELGTRGLVGRPYKEALMRWKGGIDGCQEAALPCCGATRRWGNDLGTWREACRGVGFGCDYRADDNSSETKSNSSDAVSKRWSNQHYNPCPILLEATKQHKSVRDSHGGRKIGMSRPPEPERSGAAHCLAPPQTRPSNPLHSIGGALEFNLYIYIYKTTGFNEGHAVLPASRLGVKLTSLCT